MTTTYLTVNGKIRSEQRAGEAHSRDYVLDPLGSVIQIYQNGWPIADACYEPYGGIYTQWNMEGKTFTWLGGWGYRQTGVEWSSVYVRARHYSRGMSNWTSIDPLWPSEMAYGYVEGRVMTASDPSGMDAVPYGSDFGNYVSPSLKKFLSHFGDCDVDTRSVCGAIAGPVPCLTCLQRSGETVEKWSIRQAQAYKAGRNIFNANDRNALRHCVWACDATRSCGCECAHKVDLKEIADRFRYGSTSRSDSKCDLINNRVGRIIAQINPNSKSCPELCKEMLLEGNLCITSGNFNR